MFNFAMFSFFIFCLKIEFWIRKFDLQAFFEQLLSLINNYIPKNELSFQDLP